MKRPAVRRAIGESAEKQLGHAAFTNRALRFSLGTGIAQALRALHFLFATAWSRKARTPRSGSIYIQRQDDRHKKARKLTKQEFESLCILVPLRGRSARQECRVLSLRS